MLEAHMQQGSPNSSNSTRSSSRIALDMRRKAAWLEGVTKNGKLQLELLDIRSYKMQNQISVPVHVSQSGTALLFLLDRYRSQRTHDIEQALSCSLPIAVLQSICLSYF